jgi:hypothetical protein
MMPSSKAEGTRQTSAIVIFFTAFLVFFRLSWARLEVACISVSETTLDNFLFRLLDSRDLIFSGQTVAEDVSSVFLFPFFEDLLLEAFRGATEQQATATAGIFTRRPRHRDLKDLSPQTSENTQLIHLLCFTKFL